MGLLYLRATFCTLESVVGQFHLQRRHPARSRGLLPNRPLSSSIECMGKDPEAVAQRWVRSLSLHDLEAAVDCFDRDYTDEAPARRGESVQGQDAVRQNFEKLLRDLPDLTATISRTVSDGDELWMEWGMRGTRRDGTVMEFVGVNIFQVQDGRFRSGRIYTEIVRDAGGIEAQIDRMTKGAP
ncbi:nuclear transport factor 2 family protein [Pseudarthrobacter enclensis]|nr:nuclear transport factor 2 family protein [Pseudarthrobacter enclensis]